MSSSALSVVAGSVFLGLFSKYQINNKGSRSLTPILQINYKETLDFDRLRIHYPDKRTIDTLRSWPEHKLGYFVIDPNYNPCKNQDERDALLGKILTMIRENTPNVKCLIMRDGCFSGRDFHLLRMFPELEILDLGASDNLLYLDRWDSSSKMKELPADLLNLRNLKRLGLSQCDLESFPMGLLQMEQLEALSLFGNLIKTIPHEISALKNLKHLNLNGSCGLERFPNEILGLSELTYLKLSYNNLKQIPDDIYLLGNLQYLQLLCTGINKLPESIGMLTKLKYLDIRSGLNKKCKNNITQLPSSFGYLTALEALDIDIRKVHTSHQQIAGWIRKGLPANIINKFISFAKINKASSQLRRF